MTAEISGFIGVDPTLAAPGLALAPLSEHDAPDLMAHFSDPRVTEFLDIDPLANLDEAMAIIAWAQELRGRRAGMRWSVREPISGLFMGTCGFNTLRFERGRRGEVAYDLGVAWWGQGVMAKIMPALIDFGFQSLDLHRLEARVTPGNHRSCSVLERHGFMREGLLRGFGYWKGRWQDQILYSRIAEDRQG